MTRNSPRVLTATALALLAGTGFGCFQGILDVDEAEDRRDVEVEARFFKEVPANPQGSVRVEGIHGTILVRGAPGRKQVTIEAIRRARADDPDRANELLDQLNVFVWGTPAEVLVQSVQPDLQGEQPFEVDYLITIPASMEVTVASSSGAILVANVSSDIWVEGLEGDVILRDVEGSAWVDLATGVIDTDITLPTGHVLVHKVGKGGTRVRVQPDVSAEFSAAVGSGIIDLDGLNLLRRTPNGTAMDGVLGTGEGLIHLEVGEGWVEVKGR